LLEENFRGSGNNMICNRISEFSLKSGVKLKTAPGKLHVLILSVKPKIITLM
jgi:hypothetical protein